MRAGFDDFAAVYHKEAIGPADGGEPVGDGKGGSALHQAFHGILNEHFGFGVHRGGGFV